MSVFEHDRKLFDIKTPVKKELIKKIKSILLEQYGLEATVHGYQEDKNGTHYSVEVVTDSKNVELIDIETEDLYQGYVRSVGPFSGKWLINPNGTDKNILYADIEDKKSMPWRWNPDGSSINSYRESALISELEDILIISRTNPDFFKDIRNSIRKLKRIGKSLKSVNKV